MIEVKNIRGTIKFDSNNMDQSDSFLQEVIYKMLQSRNEKFEIIDTPVEELTYGTEYDFENHSNNPNANALEDKLLVNKLIDEDESIRKYHPKSQFDQLTITIEYEYHKSDDVVYNGVRENCLVYNKEKDTVLLEEV